jgi:uncharacterized membrane protein
MAGTPIASELSRGQSGQGPFPLASQNNIKVGYVIVPDFASLGTIETWRRFYGMIGDVIGDQRYRLEIDLTTWTPLGSGTLPDDVLTEDEILDGDGYIKASLIRNLFINDSFVVASEAAMLALTTVTGNAVIRTDTGAVFIKLNNDAPAALDDFADITANTGAVTTVNGQTGAVQITIANLLSVAQNVTDFQAAVSTSPAVTTQGSAIATLQSQVTALISAVDALEGTGTKVIYKYDPLASYVVENYVIGTSGSGALELFEVISNTTPGKSPYDVDAATYYKKVGDYYTKAETDALLDDKADLVDGKVPLSQINTSELGLKVYADIAARDAFSGKYDGMRVLVLDATADVAIPDTPVTSAEYVYSPFDPLADASGFIRISTNSATSKPITATYATITAMLLAQPNQVLGFWYAVTDASTDPTVGSGWAIYEYLGTTDVDLGDYFKRQEQESIDVVIADATESQKGIAEIANQAESETASDETQSNRNHDRILTARGWRWALSSFFNWITFDRVNKSVTETGKDNLSSVIRLWRNSDLLNILTLYNDFKAEFGGSIMEIEVTDSITAGNASVNFRDITGEQFAFKDKSSNRYVTFEKLGSGVRVIRNRRSTIFDKGVGLEVYNDQESVITTTTASAQNVILSIPIPVGYMLSFKAYHMVAYATDESVISAEDLQITAKNVSGTVTSASTSITHHRLPGTLDGSFNVNINGSNIELRFQNESGTGNTYSIQVDFTYSLVLKPS